MLTPAPDSGEDVKLEKGPNIKPMPFFEPLPDRIRGSVLLKTGDDISTDEIMPAGAETLPYRSNIPEISKYAFRGIDELFHDRSGKHLNGFFIVGGNNYGQGSSREHAAIAPRFLGLTVLLAKGFSRIHRQNLINFGILPVTFQNPEDYDRILQGDTLEFIDLHKGLYEDHGIEVVNKTQKMTFIVQHRLSRHQADILLAGGLINLMRKGGEKRIRNEEF